MAAGNARDAAQVQGTALTRRPWAAAALFATLYFLGAALSGSLMLASQLGTAIWPPSGIFLAALVRAPRSQWPLLVTLAASVDVIASVALYDFPGPVALAVAAGNALEAICGAWLLTRTTGRFVLDDEAAVLRLVALSACCSTVLSAVIGGTAVAHHLDRPLFDTWALWWTGDATGVLMFAPPLLLIRRRQGRLATPVPEVLAMSLAGLGGAHLMLVSGYPVLFLLFPLMLWAAMRAEFAGAVLVAVLVILQVLLYTRHGFGPFVNIPNPELRQFLAQCFLMTFVVTGLMVAGLFQRRRVALVKLSDAHAAAEALIAQRTAELQQRAQELQHANQRLQDADAMKDHFLAALAHEVRSPLMTITTGLAVLNRDVPDAVRNRMLGSMERQTALLTRLTDDLLDVARIREGKLRLDMQPVEVALVVGAAVEAVRSEIDRLGHELEVEPVAAQALVHGDFTRLVQAVVNVLSNACRYTVPPGKIRIASTIEAGTVVLSVADNGIGIEQADLPGLFDLYGQGPQAQGHGLGIGLSLVRRIVELHGGTVHAFSAGAGQGSRFTLVLPLSDGTANKSA